MKAYNEHVIFLSNIAREALKALDVLPDTAIRTLFVVDEKYSLKGTITDGDIRRGLLNGLEISQNIKYFIQKKYRFLKEGDDNLNKIKIFKESDIFLIPIINEIDQLIEIIDLRKTYTLLPLSALIMAGGRGERLKPLTDSIPKPMLKVGDKPIIEHNIDRLIKYGVKEFFVSVKYLKEQIIDYFGDGSSKGVSIQYIEEVEPLGTLGSLTLIDKIKEENLLVMNSDILTNINFEDFFNFFLENQADMVLASIPYRVNIPYAVLEIQDCQVSSFSEKPTYTYYSNGGIYIIKSDTKNRIQKGIFYNATDLMEDIISKKGNKVAHFPLLDYWLDIGKHQDYIKAQEDIKRIHL